jgi:hypothetical protein
MNPTLELLRLIGSPFAPETPRRRHSNSELLELHQLSARNRMRFHFLRALKKAGEISSFEAMYARDENKCVMTNKAICNVSRVLTDSGISHAIFKTLRPYTSTTVDIDTIIFGEKRHYLEAARSLQKSGFKMVVIGPRSTTLRDPKSNTGVDLYEEVAVSCLIYMDKETLTDSVTSTRLLDTSISILKPEADLAAIVAHSVVKEQMYTLSEYYTFINYLKSFDVKRFLEILKSNNLVSMAVTHAGITGMLHKMAHDIVPDQLLQILENLTGETREVSLLSQNDLKTPHKYDALTVAQGLITLMKGKKTRDSVAAQFLQMLDPKFSRKLVQDTLKHFSRKTY